MAKNMNKLFGDLRSIIEEAKIKADKNNKGFIQQKKNESFYREVSIISGKIDSAKLSYQEWCDVKVYLIQSLGSWFSNSDHFGCEGWCSEIFGPKIRSTIANEHYTIIDANIPDTSIERNSQKGIMQLNHLFNDWIYDVFMDNICYMYLDLIRTVNSNNLTFDEAEPLVVSKLNKIILDTEEDMFGETLREIINISVIDHFRGYDMIPLIRVSVDKNVNVYNFINKCINFYVESDPDFPVDKIKIDKSISYLALNSLMRVIYRNLAIDINQDPLLDTQSKVAQFASFNYSSTFVKYKGILPHLKIT